MIYKELRDRLLSNPDIRKIVGNRVFGLRAPQTVALPFIVIEQVSKSPVDKLNGVTGTYFCSYTVSIFSTVPDDNSALADMVRSQLNGWIDSGAKTIRAFLDSETDDIVELTGSELEASRIVQDYELSYSE